MLDSNISPSSSGISFLKGHKIELAWKFYFYAFLSMTLMSYLGLMGQEVRFIDILDTLTSSIMLVALFGYIYKKNIFPAYVWIFVGIFCLSENVLYSYLSHVTLHGNSPSVIYTFGTILLWLINLPALLAIFLYSRSR
ncbi:hypothetical protein [Shewanella surugensis]|uniref:Uncharacterized protein n=1 Tax=Shewanella surugensis TaxID=212020 RepID=A0ABT0LEE1_9GAMM|nr:hypothetical protein [Shewanella surugensis]MCL1126074.1 hypothetical protein [Shewanella surugensis]